MTDAALMAGKEPTPRPLTGAERQARYRAARHLRCVEVPADTLARIAMIRARTSLNTQEVMALALDCLEARLAQRTKQGMPR